jgi:hypothetical protein
VSGGLLANALDLAIQGRPVFPLWPNGKTPQLADKVAVPGRDKPLGGCWLGTTDTDQIRSWWRRFPRANIGIATGYQGLVVVDVDRKADRNGFASLEAAGLTLPATYTVETPTGGGHFYYLTDNPPPNDNNLLHGVEVKGLGCYVVAPGSTIDGVPYRVGADLPLAEYPEELRHVVKPPRAGSSGGVGARPLTGILLNYEGGRNPSLFSALCSARAWGWSEAAIRALADGQFPHVPQGPPYKAEYPKHKLDAMVERALAYPPGNSLLTEPDYNTYYHAMLELHRIGWSTQALEACRSAELEEIARHQAAVAASEAGLRAYWRAS